MATQSLRDKLSPRGASWSVGRDVSWRHAGVAVALCVLLIGCRSGRDEGEPEELAPPVVPVEVERVERRDLERTAGANTTLVGPEERLVLSESGGRLTRVLVAEGDRVSRGAELARVENEDLRLSREDADASVRRLEAEVAEIRPLVERGFVPRQQLDELQFRLDQARTARERVRTQQVSQRVRAPVDGLVVGRMVEPGDLVGPSQQLFRISGAGALEAVIHLPERELAFVREGQSARVVVPALGSAAHAARVTSIHPTVDARTGTVRVRVQLDAQDAATEGVPLRPGNFAEVRITTDRREGVPAIPRRALVFEGAVPFVFVIGEVEAEATAPAAFGSGVPVHRVRRERVELGHSDDRVVELVRGPEPGAWVITVGQNGLDPDALVVPLVEGEPLREAGARRGSDGPTGALQDRHP